MNGERKAGISGKEQGNGTRTIQETYENGASWGTRKVGVIPIQIRQFFWLPHHTTTQMSEQYFETTKMFFSPENTNAKAFMEQAKSLDELKTIIGQHHIRLEGRTQHFDADMLLMAIDRYVQDGDIRHLTSAGNFRFTVISLKGY